MLWQCTQCKVSRVVFLLRHEDNNVKLPNMTGCAAHAQQAREVSPAVQCAADEVV